MIPGRHILRRPDLILQIQEPRPQLELDVLRFRDPDVHLSEVSHHKLYPLFLRLEGGAGVFGKHGKLIVPFAGLPGLPLALQILIQTIFGFP